MVYPAKPAKLFIDHHRNPRLGGGCHLTPASRVDDAYQGSRMTMLDAWAQALNPPRRIPWSLSIYIDGYVHASGSRLTPRRFLFAPPTGPKQRKPDHQPRAQRSLENGRNRKKREQNIRETQKQKRNRRCALNEANPHLPLSPSFSPQIKRDQPIPSFDSTSAPSKPQPLTFFFHTG